MTPIEKIRYRPRCVESKAYLNWLKVAIPSLKIEHVTGHATHPFCRDCTPNYAEKMRRAGLCDHPEVEFGIDEDGFVGGGVVSPCTPVYQHRESRKRSVIGIKFDGSKTLRFDSVIEAGKFCRPNKDAVSTSGLISMAARGIRKSAYGYTWRYADAS